MSSVFQRIAGTYAAYKFIELLSKKFSNWPAYETGVLSDTGEILIKKDLTTEQKASYTYFHRLIRRLKIMLEKLPGGKSKIGKIATAYYLLREEMIKSMDITDKELDEEFYKLLETPLTEEEIVQVKQDVTAQPSIATPDGNIAGSPYFSCESDTYHACVKGKRKTGRWQSYLGDSDQGKAIINYAKINPKSAIVIQDKSTNTYTFLRKPFGPNRWEY
jgi:hypothetical protein